MPAMDFAILWKFQLQYCGILICNFRYFYLTTNRLENLGFSNLYEWNDNGLILTTYNNEFYNICVSKKSIQKVSECCSINCDFIMSFLKI